MLLQILFAAHADLNVFKVYLLDIDLIGAMLNLSTKTIFHENELFQEFRRAYGDTYHPNMLIRSSPMNLKKDNNILNCPFYLISELNSLIQKNTPQLSCKNPFFFLNELSRSRGLSYNGLFL
ncbi:MAG: hypothetical protein JSS09_03420 [Verrucomicrobia bacterium]|nr:hypothetical protein [Verrucomicrobiota bacterium]